MHEPTAHYQFEQGTALIEISLSSPLQLFNSLDPAPFRDKDLDKAAEEYIVDAIDDFPLSAQAKIVLHLPPEHWQTSDAAIIPDAIHNYFRYSLAAGQRKLRATLRDGRISFAIGAAFLFVCVALRQLVLTLAPGTLGQILAEGLLIFGWVAMWRPVDTFLYGWWSIRHRCNLYRKLETIKVELRCILPMNQ